MWRRVLPSRTSLLSRTSRIPGERSAAGLTQQKIADELGVSQQTVTNDVKGDISGNDITEALLSTAAAELDHQLDTAEKRRHMNPSQLAVFALDVEKYFADKAKARQREAGEQFGRGLEEKVSAPVQKPIHAAVEAAKTVGAATRTVYQAKAVQRDAPVFSCGKLPPVSFDFDDAVDFVEGGSAVAGAFGGDGPGLRSR